MKTREEYIKSLEKTKTDLYGRSEPKYECPHCGGDVRKVLYKPVCVTTYENTIKTEFLYECDDCNYNEYISE
jgi:hypothetical protein